MKRPYIAPELKFSEGQYQVVMVNYSQQAEGEVFDKDGNSHGTIGWGGFGEDGDFGDTKQHGWNVFGGEE